MSGSEDLNAIGEAAGSTDNSNSGSVPMELGASYAPTAGFALADLLVQLEDYQPTISDSVIRHYLQLGGCSMADPRLERLLSISAQKFISDVINEAFTHHKLKVTATQGKGGKTKAVDKKTILTMEDLIPVLNDHMINIKKPPYFV